MSAIPPISFPVQVNGELMTASVIEEIIPPYQFIFRVRFSNGFEDLFYLGEAGTKGSNNTSAPYAKAISKDIDHVIGIDPTRFYHIFQETIDNEQTNVWVIEKDTPNGVSYAVYYNRFYRFELKKFGRQWIPSTVAKIYPQLNFELAKRIGFLLDSLL
jgi:hypothetical protein